MIKLLIGVVIVAFVVVVGFLIIDPDLTQFNSQTSLTEISTTEGRDTPLKDKSIKRELCFKRAVTMADLIEAAGGTTLMLI